MMIDGTSRFSVRGCLGMSLRHWWKILAFCAVTIGLAVAFIVYCPERFASEAKLYVRMGRENVALDPTVTTAQTVMIQRSQENEINSLLDILGSRWMAEQVVDSVGVDEILANGATPPEGEDGANAGPSLVDRAIAAVAYPVSDRDRAIRRIEEGLEFRAPKQSTVITISSRAGSPELAQRITTAVVEAFHDAHLHLNRTRGTHEFFAEQSKMLRDELAAVSRDLCERKNEFGMLSIEGRRKSLEGEIHAVELDRYANQRQLAAARSRVDVLKGRLASCKKDITQTVDGVAHEGWDRMREQLYDLQLKELDLTSKCTDEFPTVATVKKQRQEAEALLAKQLANRTQVTTTVNPIYESIELELGKRLAEVAALEASRDLLAQQSRELAEELRAVNRQESRVAELTRQAKLLEARYLKHAEKLEEARIDTALASEDISSLNVVQPATLESKPVSPKRALTLLGALVVCCFGSVVIVALGEQSRADAHEADPWDREPETNGKAKRRRESRPLATTPK